MKASEIFIADTNIDGFYYSRGRFTVAIKKEIGRFNVIFHCVLGVKSFTFVEDDLSHITERPESPFLFEVCEDVRDEPVDGYKEFSFISAWTNNPILVVIAKSVDVEGAARSDA